MARAEKEHGGFAVGVQTEDAIDLAVKKIACDPRFQSLRAADELESLRETSDVNQCHAI